MSIQIESLDHWRHPQNTFHASTDEELCAERESRLYAAFNATYNQSTAAAPLQPVG
jgi:hypothetical protein